MKLRPRVEPEPPKELRFRLAAETYRDLERYGELYAEQYGEAIEPATLAGEIIRQFLADDRAFRGWKRRRPARASEAARPNGEALS